MFAWSLSEAKKCGDQSVVISSLVKTGYVWFVYDFSVRNDFYGSDGVDNQSDTAWWKNLQQAAIVLSLHHAVFWIHAVLKSYHCPGPMLIKSLNMRECGGLLFSPSCELTREACCTWKLRFVKIERGQAYAIAGAQCPSQWQRMYCMCSVRGPQCASVSLS